MAEAQKKQKLSGHGDAGFGTRTIHAGQDPKRQQTGAVCVPISLASTFVQKSPGVCFPGGHEYARSSNPTRGPLEEAFAAIEGAKHGLAFASGSAALATVVALLGPGDEFISGDDVYGGTNRYLNKVAARAQGIKIKMVDFNTPGKLQEALTAKTKLVWVETPTNPMLKIIDIRAAVDAVRAHNKDIIIAVDNTFATPFFQNPLALGADLVVHSASKYINGHSDVVAGLIGTNSDDLFTRLKFLQNCIGAIIPPFDSYLILRGLKTLHIRMREHEKNAKVVAAYLSKHPKVENVIYPGLESHPGHEIAKKQMSGFGGMVTITLKGGLKESRQFLENLELFALAESLGAVECLAEHPAIMTHASVPPAQRAVLGISDSLCRLSIGIEDIEDIIKDLAHALDAITA